MAKRRQKRRLTLTLGKRIKRPKLIKVKPSLRGFIRKLQNDVRKNIVKRVDARRRIVRAQRTVYATERRLKTKNINTPQTRRDEASEARASRGKKSLSALHGPLGVVHRAPGAQCKDRPLSNRRSGGGTSRRFIPWCDARSGARGKR